MTALIATADTHLCLRNIKKHRTMTYDSLYSFSQITDLCILHNANLLIAGDVFDSIKPDPITVSWFVKSLNKLKDHNLSLYYIQGQHDKSEVPWPSICENAILLLANPIKISIGDCNHTIMGLSWAPQEQALSLYKNASKYSPDIFVGHQVWKEFNYGVSEIAFANIPQSNTLILGDYHKPIAKQIIIEHKEFESITSVYSPGSTSLMSIDEPEEKSVLLFSNGLEAPTKIILNTRPIYRRIITTAEDIISLLSESFESSDSKFPFPILEVKFNPSINGAREQIAKRFSTSTHLWIKPILSEEDFNTNIDINNQEPTKNQIQVAISEIKNIKEREIASRLWGSEDITEELSEMVEGIA